MADKKSTTSSIPRLPAGFGAVLAEIDKRTGAGADKLQTAQGADLTTLSGGTYPSRAQIGELIDGKGIYVGIWKPRDLSGESLNKTFDLYAAPENLKNTNGEHLTLMFQDAVAHVGGLKDWHGYDGLCLDDATFLLQVIQNSPELLAHWFIPTIEMLSGQAEESVADIELSIVQKDHLYGLQDKMSVEYGFDIRENEWYWSCTRLPCLADVAGAYAVNMRNHDVAVGAITGGRKDWLSVRPVRAELRL